MTHNGRIARMPLSPDHAEAVSVLAARALRAGLIRRLEALTQRGDGSGGRKNPIFISGNALERGVPPTGLQPPELAAFFQQQWPVVRTHTDTDRYRVESLLSVLWQVREVAGDIIECGSYRCGLGFLMAFAVKTWGLDKKVHLYDSFEGLPPLSGEDQAASQDTYFYEGLFQQGDLIGPARAFLAEHDLEGIVEFHKGWFDATLPLIPSDQRFCFAHIDCDLYESTQTCWTYLTPHLSAGAGVVIDDYDSHGMYRATWEYLASTGYPLYVGALKQAHFFTAPNAIGAIGQEDWAPVLANRPYCAYLTGLCSEMIVACSSPPQSPHDEKFNASLDRILGAAHKVAFLERFIAFLYQGV